VWRWARIVLGPHGSHEEIPQRQTIRFPGHVLPRAIFKGKQCGSESQEKRKPTHKENAEAGVALELLILVVSRIAHACIHGSMHVRIHV